MTKDIVHVAVAVIYDDNNRVLISQRPNHVHLGGYWEFPGGKVEQDESVEQALFREIKEELDIEIISSRPLIKVTHHYTDKSVLLDVWKVKSYSGIIKGNEGQNISWESIKRLDDIKLPEADLGIIQALKLPDSCLITGQFRSAADYMDRIETAIACDIRLIQCRFTNQCVEQHGSDTVKEIIKITDRYCQQMDVMMMLNCPDEIKAGPVKNLHLNSRKLMCHSSRPECDFLSVSCHSTEELTKAVEIGANFALLSPVQATRTHPDAVLLGWSRFSEMLHKINIPIYALGGVTQKDLVEAWKAGAQGCASMGSLWDRIP